MNKVKKDNRPKFLQERERKRINMLRLRNQRLRNQRLRNQPLKRKKIEENKDAGNDSFLMKIAKRKIPFSRWAFYALAIIFGVVGIFYLPIIDDVSSTSSERYEQELEIIDDILAFHKENDDYQVTKDKVYIIASPLTVESVVLSKEWSEQKHFEKKGRKEVSFDTLIEKEGIELETTHDFYIHNKERMTFFLEDVEKVDMVKYNYSKDITFDDAPETFEYAIGELHEYPAIDLTSDDERVQNIVEKLQEVGYPLGVLSQKETEERNQKYRELQNVIDGNKELKKVKLELSQHNVYKVTGFNMFPEKEVGNKQVNPMVRD